MLIRRGDQHHRTWRQRCGQASRPGRMIEVIHLDRGVAVHQALRRPCGLVVAFPTQPGVKPTRGDFVKVFPESD